MYKFAGWTWVDLFFFGYWDFSESDINLAPKLGMFRFDPTDSYVDVKKLPPTLPFYVDVIHYPGGTGTNRKCTDKDLAETRGVCIDLDASKIDVGHWGVSTPVVKDLFNAYVEELMKESPSIENYKLTAQSIVARYAGTSFLNIASVSPSDLNPQEIKDVTPEIAIAFGNYAEDNYLDSNEINNLLVMSQNAFNIGTTEDLDGDGIILKINSQGEIEEVDENPLLPNA